MPSLYIKPQGLLIYYALIHVFDHNESSISYASIRYAVGAFIIKCYIKADTFPDQWHGGLSLLKGRILILTAGTWGTGLLGSYLSRGFGHVVVIVRGQIDVFVDAVQQPQEELQGVVLGITTKLWSILGHYSLERGKTDLMKLYLFCSYIIMTVWLIKCLLWATKRFQCCNSSGVKLWLHREAFWNPRIYLPYPHNPTFYLTEKQKQ